MKKTLIILGGALAVSSMSASAVVTLVAGWDAFTATQEQTSAATVLLADTTATLSGTDNTTSGATEGNSWSDWNNNSFGASSDGTFGSLSNTFAPASVLTGTGTGGGNAVNLSLSREHKAGSLIFTVTNNSALNRTFDGFYFDGVARGAQSARRWTLTYGGAISGTESTELFTQGDMMGVSGTERDHFVDLSSITDNIWEAGTDAIFTLTFTGGASVPSGETGGGQETLIDNIGITADVVPEPSSTALLGLGALGLLARRRRNA